MHNGMTRRAVLASVAIPFLSGVAWGQSGGRGVVRLVVPFAPGGTTDTLARLIAPKLSERLGQTWVVENKSGASGVIGSEFVARSAPDGQVLMMSLEFHLIARHVIKGVNYDPYADFTPVARVAEEPYLLIANPRTVEPNDMSSLVAALRREPDKFTFGHAALGSVSHLVAATFARQIGVNLLILAYRGSAPALNDLMAGTIGLMVAPLAPAFGIIKSGRAKALAVATAERLPLMPDVPTFAESGFPGLDLVSWLAVWGPKGLPPTLRDNLAAAIRGVVEDPAIKRRMEELGVRPVSETPEQFEALLVRERARNERYVAEIGLMPE
jgi:tripartite-type tricarboxylate transporter receptor subunit TctC